MIPKTKIQILFGSQVIVKSITDFNSRYIEVKDFSNELNCKKSVNLTQYLEDDILNYLSSVMFRGTPCRYNSIKPNKKLGATFSKFFRCYKVLGLTVLYQYLSWKQFRIIRNRKIILLNIHGVPPKTLEVSDDFDIVFLNNSLIWYSDTYCLQFVCLCFDFIGLY